MQCQPRAKRRQQQGGAATVVLEPPPSSSIALHAPAATMSSAISARVAPGGRKKAMPGNCAAQMQLKRSFKRGGCTRVLALVAVHLQRHDAAVDVVAQSCSRRVCLRAAGVIRVPGQRGAAIDARGHASNRFLVERWAGVVGAGLCSAVEDDERLATDRIGDASRCEERVGEVADVNVAAAAHGEHWLGWRVCGPR
jgi:hypothetical protein